MVGRTRRGSRNRHTEIREGCWSGRSSGRLLRDGATIRRGTLCAGRFLSDLQGRVDCAPQRWRSSWNRTSRCTTRERCRTCCRGRTGWESSGRWARGRFASAWRSRGEIAADRCPKGNPVARGRHGRRVPIRLPWEDGRGGGRSVWIAIGSNGLRRTRRHRRQADRNR